MTVVINLRVNGISIKIIEAPYVSNIRHVWQREDNGQMGNTI